MPAAKRWADRHTTMGVESMHDRSSRPTTGPVCKEPTGSGTGRSTTADPHAEACHWCGYTPDVVGQLREDRSNMTAWTRSRTLSFTKMLLICVFTVDSLRNKIREISAFE